jgi:hypothetical protein
VTDIRCQTFIPQPGVTGGMLRCINPGTHWEHINGCGCPDPDPDICESGSDTWTCDGPHNLGA